MLNSYNLEQLDRLVRAELGSLVDCYKKLHANPELSGYEEQTSAFLARELRACGYQVTEGVGKYLKNPWRGHGVLGLLVNGPGPVVLVRADLDALPIEEQTGLPYASRVRAQREGEEVPVMHACGHDLHVTSLIGSARVLARLKESWRGTLVLVGQPGEEGGGGAQAMLNDGAYRLVPRPDAALALHATAQLPAGQAACAAGNFMASLTEVEVTLYGVGAHGSAPERAKDPVVMAAQLVLALQTIVSRELSPLEPAVVTVGSIHGGSASNIIPDQVRLLLSIRAYDDTVRDGIVASIERMAAGIALAAGVPAEQAPRVVLRVAHPANYNDPELTGRVTEALRLVLGTDQVHQAPPVMASEDFGYWGLNREIPTCMFWLGAADPELFRKSQESGVPLPSLHSPFYTPLPEPTLYTGVRATVASVLNLVNQTR
ncbi:putative amidohydrolase [Geomonas limicola]|uniref:Putative amidohydrolase n=1 Tax=Geomonas limicola TaxID=2740186 RepID=A0A6V8NB87_9BACT|nr:amidohydrolase [Geomonas limicola]GFO69776.1 putative amidohydrolase [Geomonas limicola]